LYIVTRSHDCSCAYFVFLLFVRNTSLAVTSRQISRARPHGRSLARDLTLWRHLFPAIHPMLQRNQRRYHVNNTNDYNNNTGLEVCRQRTCSWSGFWYGLLPRGLPCPRGYLGCEGCNAGARQKHQRTSEKCLCLAILLVIGGVQQHPGPGVEGESFMQVNCSACERTLKSGTQCDTCACWFHNRCRNVKVQLVDSGKWNWETCKWERLCLLEEKLQNALNQDFISVTNLMHKFIFIHIILQPSTCFEQYYAHPQEVTLHTCSL
jgi:hypothetical protein